MGLCKIFATLWYHSVITRKYVCIIWIFPRLNIQILFFERFPAVILALSDPDRVLGYATMTVADWQWCQHWHCTCRAELFCDVSDRMTVMSALTLYLSCRAVLWCQWQNDSDVSIDTVPVVPSCSVMSVTEWQWCQHWHYIVFGCATVTVTHWRCFMSWHCAYNARLCILTLTSVNSGVLHVCWIFLRQDNQLTVLVFQMY